MMDGAASSKPGWVLALSGVRFAVLRAQQDLACPIGNDATILRSVCEAIWWLCCCDEILEQTHGDIYRKYREKDGLGEQMAALRWARNRITHQEAHWALIRPPLHWNEAGMIPTHPSRNAGYDAYRDHLEGREIFEPIEQQCTWMKNYAMQFPW